jgi:hypothetical protein
MSIYAQRITELLEKLTGKTRQPAIVAVATGAATPTATVETLRAFASDDPQKGETTPMLSFFEEIGLSIVMALLKKYASTPKALAPYVTVLQHINTDTGTILAAIQTP